MRFGWAMRQRRPSPLSSAAAAAGRVTLAFPARRAPLPAGAPSWYAREARKGTRALQRELDAPSASPGERALQGIEQQRHRRRARCRYRTPAIASCRSRRRRPSAPHAAPPGAIARRLRRSRPRDDCSVRTRAVGARLPCGRRTGSLTEPWFRSNEPRPGLDAGARGMTRVGRGAADCWHWGPCKARLSGG